MTINAQFSDLAGCLKQVSQEIEYLKSRHKKCSNGDCLLAYRGESKDYGESRLMPTLFRENGLSLKERRLFDLLKDYGVVKTSNIEYAIEAQHYVEISRLLDISFNVLTAIYFTCISNDDADGVLYVFCFPEYYSPHSKYIDDYYKSIMGNDEDSKVYANNFKVISHSYTNDRIKAQKGGFIFFPGKEYKPIEEIYYKKIIINRNVKKVLIKELEDLFQITRATLFPEREALKPIIQKKFKEEVLSRYSISLEGEIEACFSRIEYELSIKYCDVHLTQDDKIKALRKLRKEESDLSFYIKNYPIGDEIAEKLKDELLDKAANRFQILRVCYGGI